MTARGRTFAALLAAVFFLAVAAPGCDGYPTADAACQSKDGKRSHVRPGSEEIDLDSGTLDPKGKEARCLNGIEVETANVDGRGGWAVD